jgi:hypothetical protein
MKYVSGHINDFLLNKLASRNNTMETWIWAVLEQYKSFPLRIFAELKNKTWQKEID